MTPSICPLYNRPFDRVTPLGPRGRIKYAAGPTRKRCRRSVERENRQLGEYRLLAHLAKGGQSAVFLAARGGPHGFFRPVVIKGIPDRNLGDRRFEALFYKEATVSSRFSHPHVVTVHDAKQVGDEHFMVMDYVAGQTVADLAQRAFSQGDGLSLHESLLIVADACEGLDYVHDFVDIDQQSYSIVHCDISPQNLMVTYQGMTRVFDFGIAQVVGETAAGSDDLVGGKFAYMSPEQCRGEGVDGRSDIFSLGVIAYELVSAQRLFRRGSVEEVKEALLTEPIDAPSKASEWVPAEIDPIIMRALEREPGERYQRAGEFGAAIRGYLSGLGVDLEALREGLGGKVAALFAQERQEVARALRDAREQMSDQALRPPSETSVEVATYRAQLIASEEALEEATARVEELNLGAQRGAELIGALSDEVRALRRRQSYFVAAIVALSLFAAAIATFSMTEVGSAVSASAEAAQQD
ncbi:protein kinase [Lujinxingia vulgaris]|uniref:Protein kinase n=1 Tax=Lujinxingia vulgaris TaxID=2600176 RepID=A0A5C6XJG9_9DELT|nr:protein kinase [Lujinxingia vulgaris]